MHEHSLCGLPSPAAGSQQLPRLTAIGGNLTDRIAESRREEQLGEIAGLEVILAAADQRLDAVRQHADRSTTTHLGTPAIGPPTGSVRTSVDIVHTSG